MEPKAAFVKLRQEMAIELERILEFWGRSAVDKTNGGFVGQITHSGLVDASANKGGILNARILWTFSAAYRFNRSERAEKLAERAFQYLKNHFWDKENGGLFWELDCFGKPVNKRKQAYALGFGIYAFSEYFRATECKESLQLAINLYDILEQHFFDEEFGGYIEALDESWNLLYDMRLSEKDENFPKSMNTHLHILEPYTNLYRVWPNQKLKKRITHLIEVFQDHIIDKQSGHFNLFFEMDWTNRSTIVSYGHDIEGAWLLNEAALVVEEKELIRKVQKDALRLVDITLNEGTDLDGSIFYERNGEHLDSDKHWWPQAEALVGLMDAWELTNNHKYLEELLRVWNFVKANIIDIENGEWYGRVDKSGKAIATEDKAGFWKCPYHNSRALIEIINRIDRSKILQQ